MLPSVLYSHSPIGTSISAWAAINGSNVNTDITYTLDNGAPTPHTVESGTAGVTLSHQNIFTIDSLSNVNHTIEVTILTQTNFSNFLFDYFLIESSSNSSMENSPTSVLFVDDTSPYLKYSSQADWTNATPYFDQDWPQGNIVMNGSSKGALREGATVSFTFTGPFTNRCFFLSADNADLVYLTSDRVGCHCIWNSIREHDACCHLHTRR